ncbi:MAG: hypothetical protein ACJZ41_06250 [Candidatus Pelagibacterales bacterium]
MGYFERVNSDEFDQKLINWVRSNLSVVKESGANVLRISFTSIDPEISKLVANAISEEYLNYQIISKQSAGLYSTEYYQERIDDLRDKQNNLSAKVLEFESNNDIYDTKVENLELDLKSFEDKIRTLENERNELLKIFTLKHPEVIKIISKIKSNNEIKNQLNKTISAARTQLSQLNNLNSEFKVNETLLNTYLNKLLTVSSFNQSDARILERSDNAFHANPNEDIIIISKNFLYGIIISIIFVGIVIFIDFYSLFNRFQISSQIKEKTGLDAIGVIPFVHSEKLDFPINFDFIKNKILIDSLKKIIIKILSNKQRSNNAFVISSPVTSDGKTYLTILLALTAKQMGKKVLLIDMDQEKKTLTKKIFGKKFKKEGFTNLRINNFPTDDLNSFITTDINNGIDVIVSGNDNNDITDYNDNFKSFLTYVSQDYDMVFCDTMPITYHPDSILISKFMNSILTIKYNSTPIAVTSHIIEEYRKLELDEPKIIFNGLDYSSKRVFRLLNFTNSKNYGYGYGYGYGYYGYGYGYTYGYGYGHKQNDENKGKNRNFLKKIYKDFFYYFKK